MVRVITIDEHGFLYLVTRNEWSAHTPLHRNPVTRPFSRILLSFTQTAECNNRTECVQQMRLLQEQHISEGSSDIRPSFLIGGYGTVYEGRGWADQVERINNSSNVLDISLVGNFATNTRHLRPPPLEMYASALTLIKYGLKNDFIYQGYGLTYFFPSYDYKFRNQHEEDGLVE